MTAPFTFSNKRGSAFGSATTTYVIDGNEITFTGTATLTGGTGRYRGIRGGRRVVFAHPDDLADRGLGDGDVVEVISRDRAGGERRGGAFRLVAYDVAPGTCAAYFPEANVLVPLDAVAAESNTPVSKAVAVRFERA